MSTAPPTLTYTCNGMAVAYTQLERPSPEIPGAIGGGVLAGHPDLVALIRRILTGPAPESVRVAEPNLDYPFTAARDTLADVAAAMLAAGNGRGRLSDLGWDVLTQAIGADDSSDPGIIH